LAYPANVGGFERLFGGHRGASASPESDQKKEHIQ